jgi:hypothetical protein
MIPDNMPRKWMMQLSQDRVIGCVDDGVSIVYALDDDFTKVEVVIVSRMEWTAWAALMDQEAVAQEEQSLNFKLAA